LRGHEQEAGHLNTESRNPLIRMQVAFELAFEKIPRPLSPDAGNSAFITSVLSWWALPWFAWAHSFF